MSRPGRAINATPRRPKTVPRALWAVSLSPRTIVDANPVRMGMRPTTNKAETPAPAYLTPVYCSQK